MTATMAAIAVVLYFVLVVVVNLVHGATGGLLSMVGLTRSYTWLLTLALFAGSFVAIGLSIKNRWDGIFIGPQNKISMSRFQLVIWTLVIGAGLLTAGLANVSIGGNTPPLDITIPKEIWALLGLGSFTFVASPAILSQKKDGPANAARLGTVNANLKRADGFANNVTAEGSVVKKAEPTDASWRDIFRGDEVADGDIVDFSKVQQLIITVLLMVTYSAALFAMFAKLNAAHISEFPTVSTGFLALLGISHAAYLGYKIAPKNN
jgi:hypothetical protein